MTTADNSKVTTSQGDLAESDAILTRQCVDLAWKITGGPDRPSAEDVAGWIKELAEHWADGQREVDALMAEEGGYPVAAMIIRGQLPEMLP